MGKTKQRPKSKEEKLRERRKHFLDEPFKEELYLDKGGEEDIPTDEDEDDDMPEEISTKKSEQKERVPLPEKKKKKRKIKKEGPGVYQVQTEDVKLKVVAAASTPAPTQMVQPSINFRELLLQESTKSGRRSSGRVSKHVEKWIKPR